MQNGTNLQFVHVAAAAEVLLGKPVLAIYAVAWCGGLRRHGMDDRIDGFGSPSAPDAQPDSHRVVD